MLTFLLRKDVAEAAQLLMELRQHRQQVSERLNEAGHQAEQFLGSPQGLGLSFAAGCLTGWAIRRHPPKPQQLKQALNQLLPLLGLVRQFV